MTKTCVKCGVAVELTAQNKSTWGKVHYGDIIKKSADNEVRQCQVDICPTCLNDVLGIH